MAEKREKSHRLSKETTKYIDCSLGLGSAAEVERLFSTNRNIISDNGKAMTLMFFEALVFLNKDRDLWDGDLVSQAIAGVG